MEWAKKGNLRWPRQRHWFKQAGEWKKSKPVYRSDWQALSEKEYERYCGRREQQRRGNKRGHEPNGATRRLAVQPIASRVAH